jgi:hypothetical protein
MLGLVIATYQISTHVQPKAAGFAEGRIDYVPACSGMATKLIDSFQGKPVDRSEFNSVKRQIDQCNSDNSPR